MKKLFFLLIGLLLMATIYSQDCSPSTSQIDLNINNVKARLLGGGDMWWDLSEAKYVVPNASGPPVSSLFAGSVWMGGIDPGGNLKFAAQTYRSGGNDYWPGPLDPSTGSTTSDDCLNWDRHFVVNRENIDVVIEDYNDNGTIDGVIPDDIKGWPATGNPFFAEIYGFDLPFTSQPLAPFFDNDGNGVYNPLEGDYPQVQGDQAIWWIFNDMGNIHTHSDGARIGMEVQATAYAYSSNEDYLNNTTLYEFKFIYRGAEPISNFYFGLWVDPDLGCGSDDQIGCSPENNLAYVYNGDDFDENCSGVNGYQAEIPILGIKLLEPQTIPEQATLGFDGLYYYNNAGSNPPPLVATTDPNGAFEHYRYLSGKWRDGLPFTFGGDAYDPASTDLVNFAFPDSPDEPTGWSMCSSGFEGSDRRFLISSGPKDLLPGAIHYLNFAVLWKANQPHPCPDISGLIADADSVEQFLNFGPVSTVDVRLNNLELSVSPNPMNFETTVELLEVGKEILDFTLYSASGRRILFKRDVHSPQLTLSRGALNEGFYTFRLTCTDGTVGVGKIVVVD